MVMAPWLNGAKYSKKNILNQMDAYLERHPLYKLLNQIFETPYLYQNGHQTFDTEVIFAVCAWTERTQIWNFQNHGCVNVKICFYTPHCRHTTTSNFYPKNNNTKLCTICAPPHTNKIICHIRYYNNTKKPPQTQPQTITQVVLQIYAIPIETDVRACNLLKYEHGLSINNNNYKNEKTNV